MHERRHPVERPSTEIPGGRVHPTRSDVVAVAEANGEFRLVTIRAVAAGARLFELEGDVFRAPTRYSVQIGEDLHLDAGGAHQLGEVFDRFFFRFMNHHCEPSTMIRGRDVIALRDLKPFEDVTFHYNTTEADMAEPFDCRCGSARCEGAIRGAKHISAASRERLRPWMAPHLLDD
jgi:hypothetical protein